MSLQDTNKRPKGYVKWNPQAKTRVILQQVLEIFEMYERQRPLTARQIFYRLVGAYGYDKTELAYNRLCEYLVRARRAGMIPFNWIRDDGTATYSADGFYGVLSFWEGTEDAVKNRYVRDRNFYQDVAIEVWCETVGMAPQLSRVARPLGVPVYSTGGFSSVTVTHEIAQRVVREDRPTVFLHIGDFDPSGQSIYEAMSEDVDTFVWQLHGARERNPDKFEHVELGSAFMYERVALTEDQVEEFDLETAPPKKTDTRSRNWVGETCQAEAMAPDDLARILETRIREHMDMDVHNKVLDAEERDKEILLPVIEKYIEFSDNEGI